MFTFEPFLSPQDLLFLPSALLNSEYLMQCHWTAVEFTKDIRNPATANLYAAYVRKIPIFALGAPRRFSNRSNTEFIKQSSPFLEVNLGSKGFVTTFEIINLTILKNRRKFRIFFLGRVIFEKRHFSVSRLLPVSDFFKKDIFDKRNW